MFFAALPKTAVLSDLNVQLMETYEALKSEPNEIINVLNQWANNETTYYRIRSEVFADIIVRAAQFIYLNRTCWNGLYRVNSSGRFNVPFGNHGRQIFDTRHLLEVAAALKDATLMSGDFGDVVQNAKSGDFIYFDPPYVTDRGEAKFKQYTEHRFTWHDQERLGDTAVELANRGCSVLVSNADYEPISSLYPGFYRMVLSRYSILAADARARRVTKELVLCSNPDYIRKLKSG